MTNQEFDREFYEKIASSGPGLSNEEWAQHIIQHLHLLSPEAIKFMESHRGYGYNWSKPVLDMVATFLLEQALELEDA